MKKDPSVWTDNINNKCTLCNNSISNCYKCVDSNVCTECIIPYFLDSSTHVCITNCNLDSNCNSFFYFFSITNSKYIFFFYFNKTLVFEVIIQTRNVFFVILLVAQIIWQIA